MGLIKIQIDAVMAQSHDIASAQRSVSDVKSTLDSLSYQIDSKICERKNIRSRLRSVCTQLNDIQGRIAAIQSAVETGASSYYAADIRAAQKASEIARNL